jgi:predicted GNAT superfamily acetyltransferase
VKDEIVIRPLRDLAEREACVALQKETWGEDFQEVVPPALLWVAQRLGGVASGAFDQQGRLVGFVFGVTGVERGALVHWSDMLAVRPELRDRGLGLRLKRHQRELLLSVGVETAYWTFEPLESRNAFLNFARLGITSGEYVRDAYGEPVSPLHRGLGTDRLVARWDIASERVDRRLDGGGGAVPDEVSAAPYCNAPTAAPAGPVCAEPDLAIDADRLRIAIPADVQRLKRTAPGQAEAWREATRAAFETYFGRGYTAVELVREGEWSSYVLERRAFTA